MNGTERIQTGICCLGGGCCQNGWRPDLVENCVAVLIERTPRFDPCPGASRRRLRATQPCRVPTPIPLSGLAQGTQLGLSDGALLAQFGPPTRLTRLLVVFSL